MNEVDEPLEATPASHVVQTLVANHRQFLSFLEARVGSRTIAEDVLQSAFVRGLEKAETVRDEERATAWFYRLLRNALTDHFRRQTTQARIHGSETIEPSDLPDPELVDTVCQCVNTLVPTLKADYAAILDAVDLRDESLDSVAQRLGITTNNAAVRLHRARQALKRQLERSCGTCVTHGCLNCDCGEHASCGHSR